MYFIVSCHILVHCIMLCCVLCCVILCCVVPCLVVVLLCSFCVCVLLCGSILCYVVLCHVMLCCVVLCCIVLWGIWLCCVMLCCNELSQLKKDYAIHSNKLLKYENYKMKLPNWKHIAMWVLPFDGEKAPSKYNTLESIEKRLDKCKIW